MPFVSALNMKTMTVQEICCFIVGVLLFLLRQESHAETETKHKVGSSLDLIPDYPKTNHSFVQWKFNYTTFAEYDNLKWTLERPYMFNERLQINQNNFSVTLKNLQLQDSGIFSIVHEEHGKQHKTKTIVLHVYDVINEVKIEHNVTWLQSQNMCTFHLQCLVYGHVNPSYSWSGFQVGNGTHLYFNLTSGETATLNCTANNSVSVKYTIETVKCEEEHGSGTFFQKYLMFIVIGAAIVSFFIVIGIIGGCYRWRTQQGNGESKDGITVYEDVNTDTVTKKRSESVINGMRIYESVDDMKVTLSAPQTVYDKISYQRHPGVTPSTSSPYQEVL